ncbi:SRR1-like protein [Gouania willdenowi]|uniref:SRR1-like domain-containing protein n=1 Tax=Gouania willdenowi TaxID=441366 RepID=A0A8C5HG69_GOUWI|nr:SRR1-like protein [Gouania willdenowi]
MSDCADEWQVARRRKGAARKSKPLPVCAVSSCQHERVDVKKSVKRITDTVAELRCEHMLKDWTDHLLAAASSLPTAIPGNKEHKERTSAQHLECVCFGLGSFSTCISARYQLALLLLLLDAGQIDLQNCFLYDPVFSPAEQDVLRELGLTVLTENEEGKRLVTRPTLFYLMHCGKALYNNLLWRNWSLERLSSLVIIGNSFSGMTERAIDREFKQDYSYISQAAGWCEERLLSCPSRLSDVFGDTSLISFPACSLNGLPQSMWAEPSEPQYQNCSDLEIILRDTQS